MTARRLVLHIGVAKTGSSLLQTTFSRLAETILSEHGIAYPSIPGVEDAAEGKATSGNGLFLAKWLSRDLSVPNIPKGWTPEWIFDDASVKEDTSTILLSSEFLMGFQPEKFADLVKLADQRGFRVEIAVYFRSVSGHALSSYSQHVKRAQYFEDFEHFVREDYVNRFLGMVRKLSRIGADVAVRAFDYERHAEGLASQFFRDCLGVSLPAAGDEKESINRSLTACEIEIIRELNRVGVGFRKNQMVCRTISDYLIEQYPESKVEKRISSSALAVLEEKYLKDVEAVNEFLPASESISFLPGDITRVEGEGRILSDAERAIVSVLGLTLKMID